METLSKLSIDSYIKGANKVPEKREKYRKRYEEIKSRISSRWFYVKSIDKVVTHIKVPSEKVDMFYDVIIQFKFGKGGNHQLMLNGGIQAFSNCPSFVYTNVDYFERNGLLIPWAKALLGVPKRTSTEDQDPKNDPIPKEITYEKSLYFALMHLSELDTIHFLTQLKNAIEVPHVQTIIKAIKDPSTVMDVRTRKALKDKPKDKEKGNGLDRKANQVPLLGTLSKAPSVKKVARVAKMGSVKKIKHI